MGRVQFVVGRAGAGKTTWVAEAVANELERAPVGGPLYWLVPEGASYVAERLLMRRVQASLRAEILSLQRFAISVLGRSSVGARPLTQAGRRMLLQTVLQTETYEGALKLLRTDHISPAKLDVVLDAFDELERSAVDSQHLAAFVADGDGLGQAGRKVRDVCALYLQYKATLRDVGMIDPMELLSAAKPYLQEAFRQGPARVWLDDFRAFTPLECSFITELARTVDHTVIALPLDASYVGAGRAGASIPVCLQRSYRTFGRLTEMFGARGIEWELVDVQGTYAAPRDGNLHQETASRPRFIPGSALALLEANLAAAKRQDQGLLSGDPVVFAAAQNARVEVEGVAHEIRRLLIQSQVAPSDIAVVLADRPGYVDLVHDLFVRYQIPHAVDDYPSLAGHPLGRFVLAALDVVEQAFHPAAVKRLLKTEFHGLEPDSADWLETYIDKYGIEGQDWVDSEAWSFGADPFGGEHRRADKLRRQVYSMIQPLYDCVESEELTAAALAQAIWACLERAGTKGTVAKWLVSDELAATPGQASLHEQAWTRVVDVLSDLAESGGLVAHDKSLLLTLVRDDLMHQPLSSIPAGLNQVLVTDLSRAHGWEAAYVFVLGVGDGQFPARAHESGLFHDDDRVCYFEAVGGELGEPLEEVQASQSADVYFTLTRASKQLWISYPLSDSAGKAARPASLVTRLKSQLGQRSTEVLWVRADTEMREVTQLSIWTPDDAIRWIAARRRRNSTATGSWTAVVEDWVTIQVDGAKRLEAVSRGSAHRPVAVGLISTTARALYGNPLAVNVHQLESYAACPYQHFARFGLRLKPDDRRDWSAALRGTLLHDTLQAFVTEQATRLEVWRQQTDEEVTQVIRRLFEVTVERYHTVFRPRRMLERHQMDEAFRVLELAAVMLTNHARHGSFSPAAVELPFGEEFDCDDGLRIDLGHGREMVLRGRIDRVDIHQENGQSVFRVIDYKSRQMVLNLDRVYHGLQLQLPVYAQVVEQMSQRWFGKRSRAVGVLYLPLVRKAEVKSAPLVEQTAYETALKQMRARGWMLADQAVVGWMDARLLRGQESELFGRLLKNDGSFSATAPVVTDSEWQVIQAHVMRLVERFGAQIADGDINIRPYDFGKGDTACRYCDFASLCQIDRRPSGELFRRLGPRPRTWPQEEVAPT